MRCQRAPLAAAVVLLCLVLGNQSALAHEVIPGVSGFPALMLHPLIRLELAACIICGSLVVARCTSFSLVMFSAAIAMGIPAGYVFAEIGPFIPYLWMATFALALAAAIAIAALNRIDSSLAVFLLALAGVAIGVSTEPETFNLRGEVEIVSATILTTAILAIGGGYLLRYLKFGWSGVLFRVLGSWVAAIILMMMALIFRT